MLLDKEIDPGVPRVGYKVEVRVDLLRLLAGQFVPVSGGIPKAVRSPGEDGEVVPLREGERLLVAGTAGGSEQLRAYVVWDSAIFLIL